jgi:hypothetical protein
MAARGKGLPRKRRWNWGKWKVENGWWITQSVEEAVGVAQSGGRPPPASGGRRGGGLASNYACHFAAQLNFRVILTHFGSYSMFCKSLTVIITLHLPMNYYFCLMLYRGFGSHPKP